MKKSFIIIFCVLISVNIKAQENFKWAKTDSVTKTKSQIYSDTKMFIAKEWKSAQNVIQNDDKEAGVIIIKGATNIPVHFPMTWNENPKTKDVLFFYTITFFVKENKYKIEIDNVYGTEVPCNDVYPGKKITIIKENDYYESMYLLKSELSGIISNYDKFIKTASKTENW